MTNVVATPAQNANATPIEKLINVVEGLMDWAVLIIMMVLPGATGNYSIAFGVAFGVSVLIMLYNYHRYRNGIVKVFPKVFEIGILVITLAILIFEVVANPSYEWSKHWTDVISSSCLLALSLFSILIGKPFTIQFAMEKVPEEYWGSEMFYFVNLIISAVWVLEFALSIMFSLLSIYVYPDNNAARIAPGIVILVLALKFTTEFPKYMRERAQKTSSNSTQDAQNGDVEANIAPMHRK